MNELSLLLLGMVGVFAAGSSIALLALGRMIDQFPTGNESARTRSITSPVETTRIAVILFWVLFVFGTWAVLQESRIVVIAGITTFFAICLFMFTALVFSFAVLNALRNRKILAEKQPVLQLAPDIPVPVALPAAEPAPVIRKRYNNFFTDFMLDALLKKD
jgi:uncharacterized BrkB/YihY/UPF0761 family membrane protein